VAERNYQDRWDGTLLEWGCPMKIRDVLVSKGSRVTTVWPHKKLNEILSVLSERNIASVVVVDHHDHPIGMITDRLILRALARNGPAALNKSARQVLEDVKDTAFEPLPVCSLDDFVGTVMRRMTERRYRHALVMDDQHMAGIVSIGDLVKVRLDDAEVESRVLRDIALGHIAAE